MNYDINYWSYLYQYFGEYRIYTVSNFYHVCSIAFATSGYKFNCYAPCAKVAIPLKRSVSWPKMPGKASCCDDGWCGNQVF